MEKLMEKDVASRIDGASISEEFKRALRGLVQEVESMLPELAVIQGRWLAYMLDRLVTEATEPTAKTHWWEVALNLVTKAAEERGEAGLPVVDAVQRAQPLLRQQLGRYEEVSLREITAETVVGICLLSETLTEPKRNYVAPNARSLAQAHFNSHAWFRAIYAGKAPVGFLMIVDNDEDEEYFVWRFMIAEPYHERGYGSQAMERLVDYIKTRPGAKELLVSCGQGDGSPEEFYEKVGFEHTGDKVGDEVVLRLELE
jgi:diamine N-acetyltransferase